MLVSVALLDILRPVTVVGVVSLQDADPLNWGFYEYGHA